MLVASSHLDVYKGIYMKTITMCLFLILFIAPINGTSAQVGTIASGALVSGIISDLENSISNLIDQLDDRVSARSFQLRMELDFLQQSIAKSSEDILDKTFVQLSQQQQTFFENTKATLIQLETQIDNIDKEIDSYLSQVEQIVAQIPFSHSTPRIRSSSPLFITEPGDNVETIKIELEGSFLKHGNAKFSIGGQSCALNGHLDTKLQFICPASAFTMNEFPVSNHSGKLEVAKETSFFQRVKALFSDDEDIIEYSIPFHVIPTKLGDYTLIAHYSKEERENKSRSGQFGRTNKHCSHTQSYNYNFGPELPGWIIDTSTIKTSLNCSRRGNHQILNQSSTGFQIKTTASNSGRCEKVFGSVVSYDGRGCESGTVTWIEYENRDKKLSKRLGTGQLAWERGLSFDLPPNFQSFILTIETIDGRVLNFNTTEGTRWLNISRDSANNTLIISPKSFSEFGI